MFDQVRQIYAQSLKPQDRKSNVLLFRVLAAPVVLLCARLGISPNQVTLSSLIPMVFGAACWVMLPGSEGLWLGILFIECAYILDCVDGQLARYTDRSSSVGAELDFLMDEVKALILIGSGWIRLHRAGDSDALLIGVLTLMVLAIAFALTRFVRHPIYADATGTTQRKHGTPPPSRGGLLGLIEWSFRFIAFYPESLPITYLLACAVGGDLERGFALFLILYGLVHLLYVAQLGFTLVWKFGVPRSQGTDSGDDSL